MNIPNVLKYYFTETFLKTAIRKPSQLNLPPTALRPMLEQLCRAFPKQKNVNVRPIRLAGIKGEEIKAQDSATQLIFHIHGGAFFLGSLKTHHAFMTDLAARTQMQIIHVDYPLAPEHPWRFKLRSCFLFLTSLCQSGTAAAGERESGARDARTPIRFQRLTSGVTSDWRHLMDEE